MLFDYRDTVPLQGMPPVSIKDMEAFLHNRLAEGWRLLALFGLPESAAENAPVGLCCVLAQDSSHYLAALRTTPLQSYASMGGLMGGLLAGSLIGSLLGGHGFAGGGFMDILIFGLLIYVGLKLFAVFRGAQQPAQTQAGTENRANYANYEKQEAGMPLCGYFPCSSNTSFSFSTSRAESKSPPSARETATMLRTDR